VRSWLLPAALALWPALATAQDWATAEVCTVDPDLFDEAVFDPPGLAALEAEAAKTPNGTGRFWQVTAPNGAVSHLWGTWHSADPLILDLPAQAAEIIHDSRVVAVETNFIAPDRDAWREAQYYEGRYLGPSDPFEFSGADSTGIAGLDDEISGWIRERAIELGWTEDVTLILSPAGIAEMLLSDPCEDFAEGVLPIQDDYIQLLGRLAGAEVLSLEGPHDFLDFLNGDVAGTAEAITAVYAAYLEPQEDNAARSAQFRLYLEGRLGLLAAWDASFLERVLGKRGPVALRATDAYLLTYRNERFLEKLAPEWDAGGVFVAVGAGHLAGATGLVEMLRDQGFTVARLPLPGETE
jgi:uncharacterized protein YbaP (TraB family)